MTGAPSLAARLAARGTPWPAPIHHLDTVPSTNDHLKALAQAGAPEWTTVMADHQTAGRGRHGRAWHSRHGDLFLSVLLRPVVLRELSGLLPLAAGLAVAEALEELAVPAQLKWPNDVLVAGRKISGILCESTSGPAGLETVVVGIGVNVAAPTGELPAELRGRATSLRAEGGSGDAVEVAAAVLARLPVWYHAVPAGSAVRRAWRGRSVAWWGELVEVRAGEVLLVGRPRDLADDGGLLLQLEDGSLTKVLSGEVRELRRNAPGGQGLTPA